MSKNKKELKEKTKRAEELSAYYRSGVMNENTLEFLQKEDFSNLMDVARFAEFGRSTAIQSAFCIGYIAGKDGVDNEQK